jgi:hypothetical protein
LAPDGPQTQLYPYVVLVRIRAARGEVWRPLGRGLRAPPPRSRRNPEFRFGRFLESAELSALAWLPIPPRIEAKSPACLLSVQMVLTVGVPLPARFEQPPLTVE